MAYNQRTNFWDFVNSFDSNRHSTGEGVDHHQTPPVFPFGFPFGGPPHHRGGPQHGHAAFPWGDYEQWNPWTGGGGRRGGRDGPPHHHHQQEQQERNDSETMRAESDVPDPAEVTPDESDDGARPRGPPHGHHGPRRGRCGGRGGCRRHGHPHHPPPYPGFDFASMINNLNDHPFFQSLREQFNPNETSNTRNATTNNNNTENDVETFTPPLDLFSTPSTYTLHLAIPGAKKEDVGVNWDPETSTLHIAGVIHRIGDEEFLKTLQGKGERTVGMFERKVELKGEEIDGEGISAKLEDGVLVVTVPKIEKGWTEIKKVDIE